MPDISFSSSAWEDYLSWQATDLKKTRRINQLIEDIKRNGHRGIGKPEALKHDFSGWWSRRIDERNRLIYRILENGTIQIAQCKNHYRDA